MKNPLSSKYSETTNQTLVKQALKGDRKALDELIHLHQPFIYNVAWKMVHDPNDAMDLTQETLLKVITKLSQFNFKSSFRTWLYRIVVNEFLQTKRRKMENTLSSFEEHASRLDSIPTPELNEEEYIAFAELSREMQIRCLSGMLMCLTREQRLIYILGDTFGTNHKIGAEIFEMSPQNFRIKLHRARKDLHNYIHNKCGLINKANPCRCPKKTKALKAAGALDEKKMVFNISYKHKIVAYAEESYEGLMYQIEDKVTELYRDHPTKEDFDKTTIVNQILNDEDLMTYLK
ncbi:MAG TPA: RNA polymerase subunit sigma-70 [Microscillaceae bacterium]|nr:RNA polymerase subunit sigma-70 [Microscillaceae bacterium]